MGIIQLKNLSFSYENQIEPLFKQVNLEINSKWKLGLIGRNGRGKTTFLKILQNQLSYNGQLLTDLKFNYFPAKVENPKLTLEQILMKITHRDYSNFWEVERELNQIDLDLDLLSREYDTLSPGQQTKALLSAMFANQNDFQLIDEPTNHLDQAGGELLAKYLKSKQGFIVVSHDREFLNQIIDHVISIDRAKISSFKGNYDTWSTERQAADKRERQQKADLQKDIKKLTEAAYQKKAWSKSTEREKVGAADKGFIGHKSAKVMSKALNIQKRADKKISDKKRLLQNIELQDELQLNYQSENNLRQRPLIATQDLVLIRNEKILNHPINFELKATDRLVISGGNGAGKSTLIKALLGEDKLIESGTIRVNKELKISYLPQDFDQIRGTMSAFAAEKGVELQSLFSTLRKLGFERELFGQDLEKLSMGQKRKVALARSLNEEAECYIWDEPLNYLDVITREQIQSLIQKYKPSMIIIDHDQKFCDCVQTKKIKL